MDKPYQLMLGVLLAVLYILFARTSGPRRELVIYGVGLIVAALIYVAFSFTGAGTWWLIIELIGLAVFTLLAVLGLQVSPWFLAAGWALHISWDVFLHLARPQAFVPDWYPVICISFDLIVAGFIAMKLRKPAI